MAQPRKILALCQPFALLDLQQRRILICSSSCETTPSVVDHHVSSHVTTILFEARVALSGGFCRCTCPTVGTQAPGSRRDVLWVRSVCQILKRDTRRYHEVPGIIGRLKSIPPNLCAPSQWFWYFVPRLT